MKGLKYATGGNEEWPTVENRVVLAASLIEELHGLEMDIHKHGSRLADLKRYQAEAKLRILVEGSVDDPKALGSNAELRNAAVEHLYLQMPEGVARDAEITALEAQLPLLRIERDWKHRLYRLEIAVLEGCT